MLGGSSVEEVVSQLDRLPGVVPRLQQTVPVGPAWGSVARFLSYTAS